MRGQHKYHIFTTPIICSDIFQSSFIDICPLQKLSLFSHLVVVFHLDWESIIPQWFQSFFSPIIRYLLDLSVPLGPLDISLTFN